MALAIYSHMNSLYLCLVFDDYLAFVVEKTVRETPNLEVAVLKPILSKVRRIRSLFLFFLIHFIKLIFCSVFASVCEVQLRLCESFIFKNHFNIVKISIYNIYVMLLYVLQFITRKVSMDAFSLVYSKLLLAELRLFVFDATASWHWQFILI